MSFMLLRVTMSEVEENAIDLFPKGEIPNPYNVLVMRVSTINRFKYNNGVWFNSVLTS